MTVNAPARIFRDESLEQTFLTQGFVVVPFLDAPTLARLREIYEAVDPCLDEPFYTSMWSDSEAYRGRVNREVEAVLAPPFRRWVKDFEPFASGFLVKHPRAGSSVPLHQDWSYTDEDHDPVVIAWCPLRDVDHDDGCLAVVPGSHALWTHARPNGQDEPWMPYTGHEDSLASRYAVELPMRAGDAVLYDPRLLHASRDNTSGRLRVAAGVATAPRGAQLMHYFIAGGDVLERYAVPWDFYWRLVRPGERPTHPDVRRLDDVRVERPSRDPAALREVCERSLRPVHP